MKNFFKYGVIILLLAMPMLSLAAEFRGGEQLSIGKDERIVNDVYMAGGSVMSAGSINGDLIVAGGNIVITGDIEADLIAMGGNVNILSNIGDDARIGGGTIVLNGGIGGDLMIGGGQVTISGSGVEGDVVVGGGNVRIDAPVEGNIIVGGGNIYINSLIKGNVEIKAQKITLGKNAVIFGNLTYESSEELVRETGSIVKGIVDFRMLAKKMVPSQIFKAIFSAFILWKFFALLACALVVGLVMRRFSKEIVMLAKRRPLFELGRGIIAMMIIPVISILLMVILVGIPFGIMGLLAFIIMMLFAWIITPIIVGSVVFHYLSKKELEVSWKTILLGVLLCMLLGSVPFIGGFVQTLLMFVSFGSIIALKLQYIKAWR
jgi:cytoskeletal protein CcmA (bactofilin family)